MNYAKNTERKFVIINKLNKGNTHESEEIIMNSLTKIFGTLIYYTKDDYKTWKIISDPNQNAYGYKSLPLHKGASVLFDGYFQASPYFYTIKPAFNQPKKHQAYFMHIRLGDYLTLSKFKISLKKYYTEAILNIMENDPHATFLVFSDDNAKAQEFINANIKVPFTYTFSQSITALDTFLEMASCNGAICANSSLSWMAAFYQQSTKIYMPKPWYNANYPVEIYPDWATIIDVHE
jgi:hypothetical protein